MRVAAADAGAPVNRRQGVRGEADALAIAFGMMNAHTAGGRGVGTVPAGVIDSIRRRRELIELDQGEVHVRLGCPKSCARLVLIQRTAQPVLTAGGRLVASINHHAGGVGGRDAAVVGRQQKRAKITRHVHDQAAAAQTGSSDRDAGHGADFVGPRGRLRARPRQSHRTRPSGVIRFLPRWNKSRYPAATCVKASRGSSSSPAGKNNSMSAASPGTTGVQSWLEGVLSAAV